MEQMWLSDKKSVGKSDCTRSFRSIDISFAREAYRVTVFVSAPMPHRCDISVYWTNACLCMRYDISISKGMKETEGFCQFESPSKVFHFNVDHFVVLENNQLHAVEFFFKHFGKHLEKWNIFSRSYCEIFN